MKTNSPPQSISRWSATIHIVGFLIFAGGIFLLALFKELDFNPKILLSVIMPVAVGVNLIWYFISRKKPHNTNLFYAFIFINLAVTTLIIHFSGGQESPFLFLYLISIVSVSLISFRSTIVASAISIILFAVVIFLEPPAGISLAIMIRSLRVVLLATVVTFQSYYLVSRIKRADEELLMLKDRFIFRTMHDIKSPLASIKWLLEKYQRENFKTKYPEIQEDIKLIEESISRVLGISEHLLNLAKGKKEEIKLELVDLNMLLSGILNEMQPEISKKNIKVNFDPSQKLQPVIANFELLQEALANLMGNGIKYNSQNGELSIWYSREDNFIKTHILNTGPKIPADVINKLFTPYFRGNMEKAVAGTGIGLYIAKEVVEKLGGRVGLESSTDENTIFYVTLPIANK